METQLLKCAVVDDSRLQRLSIVRLIEMHPALQLVGDYNNAVELKMKVNEISIDLLFLDIEMPILSGFDLLDNLAKRPQVIIVTGKTQYAFKAFQYDVVDYLQKPVGKEAFFNAVRKAVKNHQAKNESANESDEFIFVKSDLKMKKVFIDDILYIEAMGDYVKLKTKNDPSIIVLSSMKDFILTLPEKRFLRIHKSYIINLAQVRGYSSKTVELLDEKLPLSRKRKPELDIAMNSNSAHQ